jgi:hypothetical protein
LLIFTQTLLALTQNQQMLIIESGAYTFIHKKSREYKHPYCGAFIKDKVFGYNPS